MLKYGVWIWLALSVAAWGQEVLDRINFGDASAEAAHGTQSVNAEITTGGLGQLCRRISGEGFITFTLACDPAAPTYLTVKLWGSDTVSGTQYLYLYDLANRIGSYQDDWPEVAAWGSQPPFPGRFVYSTYLLPASLTQGKQQVTLKLAGAALGIYSVSTHLDAFFDAAGEVKGSDPGPGPVRPAGARSAYDQLVYQANLGIAELLTWQKYGPSWNASVAAGNAPAVITGAITFNGGGFNSSWTVQQWKEDMYARFTSANSVCLQALEAYAIAYRRPWSNYCQNPEMVDRIVKGLDFLRIAQGANGAWGNPWGRKWVGGPNRVNGAQCLEGFGIHALADAFLLVHEDISLSVMNALVDEDDNPSTAMVTRKTSYINLFKGIISHMLNDRGHAPNQDRAQVHAMYKANKCLEILSPADAWPQSTALQWVYEAMGALPCPIYDGWWESEKGLALEVHGTINGGYCGNYGTAALGFAHVYGRMTGGGNAMVNALINREVDAFANFVFVQNDDEGFRGLANESVISWRPNRYPGNQFPSGGVINGLAYAAVQLGNANATRILQHWLANRRLYTIDCSASAVTAHYEDNTLAAIHLVDVIEQVEALPATSARLPMESAQTFAWADEQAAGVALQHNGGRLYMTLNWRHDYCSGCGRTEATAAANNIARIHYTTADEDRIANVAMQTPYGMFKLYTCAFGDYYVAVNVSATQPFTLDVAGFETEYAADLVSGRRIDLRLPVVLPPRSTMVLYPGPCTEHLRSDLNRDCFVNLQDFAEFASEWLRSFVN